jgi:aminopeptidase YwaD
MTKIFRILLIAGVTMFAFQCSPSKQISAGKEESVTGILTYLASDALIGRYPGTAGDSIARFFIRNQFSSNHISLLYNEGFQEVNFNKSRIPGANTSFYINRKLLENNRDLVLFSFTAPDTVIAPVVFAGYGIMVSTDSLSWNDYAGTDVKQKWVMLLRGSPDFEGSDALFGKSTEDRDKAMGARDNGAAGVLFVSGSRFDEEDKLEVFDATVSSVGIPVFQLKRYVADELLSGNYTTTTELESKIAGSRKPIAFELTDTIKGISDIRSVKGKTYNVAGIVEGSDPVLKNEFVVIGAHYDHLGMGGKSSSSRRPDTVAVHNGADDNASGIAAMIYLAEKIRKIRKQFKRSIIFVAFGAEEMGLLGSKQFVASLPVDSGKISAMINLDMVGRLDTSKGIQISGTGTSLEADSLLAIANKPFGFKLKKSPEGFGPSDHASFYGKNIPVFFITTGAHTEYHTPWDDAENINFHGLETVADFAYKLTEGIANHPDKLQFREAGPKTSASTGRKFRVTLGFMPGYADEKIQGVRVEFVTKGKPADLGGIKNGDIITAINGLGIQNIYDYMYRLSKLSPGDRISVEVKRNDKKEVLIIQL